MADDKKKQPIIIKKKKGGHGGHHGGAWKIAYADFVTAMMAFFMVMWVIGLDVQTKQGIAAFFQNMSARSRNEPASPHILHMKGSPPVKPRPRPPIPHDNNLDAQNAQKLKNQIEALVASNPQTERLRTNMEISILDTEMHIDFVEGTDTGLFEGNGKELRTDAKRLIEAAGTILSRHRHLFSIEGHTDGRPVGQPGYGKWELAADRANAVRAALANVGMNEERVLAVQSYADIHLRFPKDPMNPGNRRVTLVVPFDLPDGDRLTE
jgi:chemotaxis protein MotB